jgi:hypothetical protein
MNPTENPHGSQGRELSQEEKDRLKRLHSRQPNQAERDLAARVERKAGVLLHAVKVLHPDLKEDESVELRVIDARVKGRASFPTLAEGAERHAVSRTYSQDKLGEMALKAAHLEDSEGGDAKGVYFTLNPVRSGKDGRSEDGDISRRTTLLIDCDPVKPEAASNSTDEEKAASKTKALAVRDWLTEQDWPTPILADSGNGYHLLYRIDLPNDQEALALVQRVLAALAARFDDDVVVIDQKVFNASRITKLYGTMTRKGEHTPDRPQRESCLLDVPDKWETVPWPLLQKLTSGAPQTSAPTGRPSGGGRKAGDPKRHWQLARIKAYLADYPPAVDGENGHGVTFDAAIAAVRGFAPSPEEALSDEELMPVLKEYSDRCQPPWNDKELRHKLKDAREKAKLPWGFLLDHAGGSLPSDSAPEKPKGKAKAMIIPFEDIEAEPTEWLWPGKIAWGEVTTIEGDPDVNKSTLTLDLAARVSQGMPMPMSDGTHRLSEPAGVLIVAMEDAPGRTIKPRLMAAGADTVRVSHLPHMTNPDGTTRPFRLPEDTGAIEQGLKDSGARLLIIDPLFNHIDGNVDTNSDHKVRAALSPLAALAQRLNIAVVVVRHFHKGTIGRAIHRGGGSVGIVGLVRTSLIVTRDKADKQARILAVSKNNISSDEARDSARFKVTSWGGETKKGIKLSAPRIDPESWEPHEATADDLVNDEYTPGGSRSRPPSKVDEAAEFIRDYLVEHGPSPAGAVKAAARKAGFTESTVYRAQGKLEIMHLGDQWILVKEHLIDEVKESSKKNSSNPSQSTSSPDDGADTIPFRRPQFDGTTTQHAATPSRNGTGFHIESD